QLSGKLWTEAGEPQYHFRVWRAPALLGVLIGTLAPILSGRGYFSSGLRQSPTPMTRLGSDYLSNFLQVFAGPIAPASSKVARSVPKRSVARSLSPSPLVPIFLRVGDYLDGNAYRHCRHVPRIFWKEFASILSQGECARAPT